MWMTFLCSFCAALCSFFLQIEIDPWSWLTVYCPGTFHLVRQLLLVDDADYCKEWNDVTHTELAHGAGRSGALFLRSASEKYLLKTILRDEVCFLSLYDFLILEFFFDRRSLFLLPHGKMHWKRVAIRGAIRACSWEVENNNRWKIVSFCGWKVTPWKFGNLCSFVFSMLGSAFWSWRTNYFRFHSQHDDLVFGEGQMALSKVGAFQDWGDGICPDSVSYLG